MLQSFMVVLFPELHIAFADAFHPIENCSRQIQSVVSGGPQDFPVFSNHFNYVSVPNCEFVPTYSKLPASYWPFLGDLQLIV